MTVIRLLDRYWIAASPKSSLLNWILYPLQRKTGWKLQ